MIEATASTLLHTAWPPAGAVDSFSRLTVRLDRHPEVGLSNLPDLARPAETAFFLWDRFFSTLDREALCALYLSARSGLIGWSIVHLGTISACYAEPRLILLPAILSTATQIIIAHNHPAGSLAASPEDSLASHKLAAACTLLNIRLADSLILAEPVGPGGPPRWARISWPGKENPPYDWKQYGTDAGVLGPEGLWVAE